MKHKIGDEVLLKGKIIDILELDNDADLVTIKLKSERKIFYVNIDDLTSVKTGKTAVDEYEQLINRIME
jgi:hypothetical protein